MATPEQLERIAAAAHALRPDWPHQSLLTHLTANHGTRPYRDLAAAMAYVAADSQTHTPARLGQPGPWWRIGDAAERTPDQPHPKCPNHGHPQPCQECSAGTRPATPDDIAALKAAARRTP